MQHRLLRRRIVDLLPTSSIAARLIHHSCSDQALRLPTGTTVAHVCFMEPKRCSECGGETLFLTDSSTDAAMSYYGCEGCGVVWVLNKRDRTEALRVVSQTRNDFNEDDAEERSARFSTFRVYYSR